MHIEGIEATSTPEESARKRAADTSTPQSSLSNERVVD
jgi:hypothetical protein